MKNAPLTNTKESENPSVSKWVNFTTPANSKMSVEQIKHFIETNSPLPKGYCVSVTINNTGSIYGFFERFPDSVELEKENKWRFIPINQYEKYYWEVHRSGSQNPKHSIILYGSHITELKVISQDRIIL